MINLDYGKNIIANIEIYNQSKIAIYTIDSSSGAMTVEYSASAIFARVSFNALISINIQINM